MVVLRYRGLAAARRQIRAARKGWLLNDPDRYDAVVATVRQLMVRPASSRPYLFNLDGLRLVGRGEVRVSLAGRVWLVRAA